MHNLLANDFQGQFIVVGWSYIVAICPPIEINSSLNLSSDPKLDHFRNVTYLDALAIHSSSELHTLAIHSSSELHTCS
jgi:hypothetical protein